MSYGAARRLTDRLQSRAADAADVDLEAATSRRAVLGGLALAGGGSLVGVSSADGDHGDAGHGGGAGATDADRGYGDHGNFGVEGEYSGEHFDPHDFLRTFNTGEPRGDDDALNLGVSEERHRGERRTVREFQITAVDRSLEVLPGIEFPMWTYNGTVPGPTLRAEEGDLLRVHFRNESVRHAHTIHPHVRNLDPDEDGIPQNGPGVLNPGESYTYEWIAQPAGTHLYHCHSLPLKAHIHRGLYGALVVDPVPERARRNPREYLDYDGPVDASVRDRAERLARERNQVSHPDVVPDGHAGIDEMVMVMNGFDTNFDGDNEVYAVNTRGFAYGVGQTDGRGNWEPGETVKPIQVNKDDLLRVHLVNATEFDPINSFHTHSQFFDYYQAGTGLSPSHRTVDTVMLCQAQRGMVELDYSEHDAPGLYMFHAHQSEFAELGWMSFFEVV